MTATLGRVEEFDGSKEEWQQYVERLGHFFIANGIDSAEKKRAVFLSVIGPSTYKVLHNLVSPVKPGEKTFDELVEALSKHYNPAPSEIVQRCKFHSRLRKPGESVAVFVSELRSLSEYCKFGESLEIMIRDRLVCGICDDAIQKRLLSETDLTYTKAVSLALGIEAATHNVQELKSRRDFDASASRSQEVHQYTAASGAKIVCHRCGTPGHIAPKCRVDKEIVCRQCGEKGHIQKACRKQQKEPKKWHRPKSVRRIQEGDSDEGDSDGDLEADNTLYHVRSHVYSNTPPLTVKMEVDNCLVTMEIDTGASMTLMSENIFNRLWPGRSLSTTKIRLCSYSKEPIPVVGCCNVNIAYKSQTAVNMPLIVVEGVGPSLLGRNWLSHIRFDWNSIHTIHSDPVQTVLDRHPSVFREGLGTLNGFKAKIYVDPDAQPRFFRARPVPYAFRDKVDKELERLQGEGTIEPVEISDWAAPIVTVLKSDKESVRICGDFRITVNPVSKLDKYPIPKVEDLFASMKKGKYFTKLDLSQAYQQLPLDDDSKKYVVINTHKGLFRYTRLPYGISSAPGIFQRVIESLLQGIDGVIVYLDDILITGHTEEEHLKSLEEVLSRLEKAGLRVKRKKCEFMRSSVEYLGHKIDETGLHPLLNKIRAIKEAPTPRFVNHIWGF